MKFSELGLCEPLVRAVTEAGYSIPTPIQQQAIPAVLQGRDVVGIAQTGTGKTAGFTLPMLERLRHGPRARNNVVRSLDRPVVAAFYIVANIALGTHLFHGVWSLFQSMGWNNPRFKQWRRHLAVLISTVVVVVNVSFPVAVLAGIVGN